MLGIHAAVTRTAPNGGPEDGWVPEERLSVAEAIGTYTWNGAWNGHNERRRGEIAPGRDADLVVLERDPFLAPARELADIGVAMTLCGGRITPRRSGSRMSRPRRSGILLPLFALPSRYGIGDMGPEALRFADFLRDAAQTVWQVLPLTAIDGGCGNSPYSPTSAFAGNPLLISPEALADSGLIDEADLADAPAFDDVRVDYDRVRAFKDVLLRWVWSNFKRAGARSRYERFFADNRHWLEGYSFFAAIKGCRGGQPWYEWPEDLKFRRHEALHRTWMEMADEIEFHRFVQFLFSSQMGALRSRLSDLGICLVGDVPVYVTRDCADVWLHPHLFELDEALAPVSVAGVPPDYFSATGQLWGNPLYNWDAMLAEDRSRSEERRVGKECRSRWSPYH